MIALFIIPLTIILLVFGLITKKTFFFKFLGFVYFAIFALILFAGIFRFFTKKKVLEKNDYYGEYIVKRNFFKGEQSDWQYDHFRFEITKNDEMLFHVTEGQKILETYKGRVQTTKRHNHRSARLIIDMDDPVHHIVSDNPTTYRNVWDFYLVFNSPKFYNVFFEKGKWQPVKHLRN